MMKTAVLVTLALVVPCHGACADAFQAGKPLSADAILARCPSEQGGLATSPCLGQQLKQLSTVLKKRISEMTAEIDRAAARPAKPGLVDGPPAAAWKRDFNASQEAWERYNYRECRNVFEYENRGGSAAGLFQQACQIRHIALRINELSTP